VNQGWGSIKADAYQFAGYVSWSYPNWFADVALSGGVSKLDVTRPGIVGNLTGSPDATSFVANGKTGYLFDVGAVPLGTGNAGTFKAGPIAGLTYSKVSVNGYTETGDPILNQIVGAQDTEGVTGRAGLGIRFPFLIGAAVATPWLDVTAERDFLDGARVLTTAQAYAPALTIATPVSNVRHTYGRVAGGLSAQVWRNVSANLNGEATFGRTDSNDYALTGGFKVVW
jgi:outer membrane autotransporter protein